jgi:hypothetical protein
LGDTNSLSSLRPEIASEWILVKNHPLLPTQVTCGSGKNVWWQCSKSPDHQWQAAVKDRTQGRGCPICIPLGSRHVTDENRLSTLFPEIAAEWHPYKNRLLFETEGTGTQKQRTLLAPEILAKENRPLLPSDVSSNSSEYIWWQCKRSEQHVWCARIDWRTLHANGCPFCSGKKVCQENSLAQNYPDLSKQWHPTRNYPLDSANVTPGSSKQVWWRCSKSPDHIWRMQVSAMVAAWKKGTNRCPLCPRNRVEKSESKPKHKLLLDNPAVVLLWHEEKNRPLQASQVKLSDPRYFWWRCPESPTHVWKSHVRSMVYLHKSGRICCPFCAGKRKPNAPWTTTARQDWQASTYL